MAVDACQVQGRRALLTGYRTGKVADKLRIADSMHCVVLVLQHHHGAVSAGVRS